MNFNTPPSLDIRVKTVATGAQLVENFEMPHDGGTLISVRVKTPDANSPPLNVKIELDEGEFSLSRLARGWARNGDADNASEDVGGSGALPFKGRAGRKPRVVFYVRNDTGATVTVELSISYISGVFVPGSWDSYGKQWAMWVYQATVINGASIATPTVILTPGVGNEFELDYGRVSHDDATASTVNALIRDDGARTLASLLTLASVTQNSVNQFPTAPQAAATGGNDSDSPAATRFLISGDMDLYIDAVDIDATEGITVVIVGRIRDGVPTVAETGGGTPTITINTEKVY